MNKIKALSLFLVFCSSVPSYAINLKLLSGIGFTAPNVNGTSNVGNPTIGDIIFDTSNDNFYGYKGGMTTPWILLGGSAPAPTLPGFHKFTAPGAATYTVPNPAPLYIRVIMAGAGGGGGGSGTSGMTDGDDGDDTTFHLTSGPTLLVAGGGEGGSSVNGAIAVGGPASLGSGPVGQAITGGSGWGSSTTPANIYLQGNGGGSNSFGGAGPASNALGAGNAAVANTGGGGGGAGTGGVGSYSGGGGGAGGYVNAIVYSPTAASTYDYTVGTHGAGGNGGAGGSAGGDGADGIIIVEEYYQ